MMFGKQNVFTSMVLRTEPTPSSAKEVSAKLKAVQEGRPAGRSRKRSTTPS